AESSHGVPPHPDLWDGPNLSSFIRRISMQPTSNPVLSGASAASSVNLRAGDTVSKEHGALALPPTTRRGDMLYRELGRTGEQVSLIGLGGAHIGKQDEEQESIRIIRSAIDGGITFLDNSWDYNDGLSEMRMGKALRDGY